MPSYSFGHRWVGIVAGSEPPAQQTLMAIAAGSTPTASSAERPARSRLRNSAQAAVRPNRIPLSVRQRHAWHQLMLEALTEEEQKRLDELKKQSDQAIRDRNRAANRVSMANRSLRKPKPGTDAESIRSEARAAAADVARIKEYQQSLLAAREQLFSEPAKRVLAMVGTSSG